MDGLRRAIASGEKDLAEFTDSGLQPQHDALVESTIKCRISWNDMRQMYCQANAGATYTNLQGELEACK
jgi:hypothetical protein